MERRALLSMFGAGAISVMAGCTVLGQQSGGSDDPKPAYIGKEDVVTGCKNICLKIQSKPVRLDQQVKIMVVNEGDETASLGCNLPWALQRYSDGSWNHVAWTGDRYYDLCTAVLKPEDSQEVTFTLSESGLKQQASDVRAPINPGRYRFLLIGAEPHYALEFEVRSSE